jgi:hypothetical protein
MSSRKKKKKRDRKKHGRPSKPGLRPPGVLGDSVVFATPPGERKMSEVLLEFIEPYADQWQSPDDLRKLLGMASVAWNAALLPGGERAKMIQDIVEAVPPEARAFMIGFVEEMILRKLTHFADNRRAILNYQVTMTPSGPHVQVMSTLDRP